MYLHITIVFFLIVGLFNTIDNIKINKENVQVIPVKKDTISNLNDTISAKNLSELENKKPVIIIHSDTKQLNDEIHNNNLSKNELLANVFIDSVLTNSNTLQQLQNNRFSKKEKDSIFNDLFTEIKNYSLLFYKKNKDEEYKDWDELESSHELNNHSLDHIGNILKEKQIAYEIPSYFKTSLNEDLKSRISNKYFKKLFSFMDYDKKNKDSDVSDALDALGYKKNYWNVFLYTKTQNLNKSFDDPEFFSSYADRFLSKISIALFFLLPIFTLIVALIYIRSKFIYTEHLIFVLHVQTAFFLLLILFILIEQIYDNEYGILIFFFLFLIYLYKALRNFYKQNRLKTIIKFLILNIFFMIFLAIGGTFISFIAFLV